MSQHDLSGCKVAALMTDLFEQVEFTEPKQALEEAGATVTVIAPEGGTVQGAHHAEKADEFAVDLTLEEADPADYDALLLPGGAMNADALRVDEQAQKFAQAIDGASKPIAVICHGGWLLVSAGLVKGHRMTSFHTIADDIKNAGGKWEDAECIVDGTWVSSRKPDDLPVFNREMLALFAEQKVTA